VKEPTRKREARPQPVVEKVAHGETLRRINIGGYCWLRELTHSGELIKDLKKALNLK
jgi:hypothetical protein